MNDTTDTKTLIQRAIDQRIDERFADLADYMKSAAYMDKLIPAAYKRNSGGTLGSALACVFDDIERALLYNIDEMGE